MDGAMSCRCEEISELRGDEAKSYADEHLEQVEVRRTDGKCCTAARSLAASGLRTTQGARSTAAARCGCAVSTPAATDDQSSEAATGTWSRAARLPHVAGLRQLSIGCLPPNSGEARVRSCIATARWTTEPRIR